MEKSVLNKWLENSYSNGKNQEVIALVIEQNNPPYNLDELQRISYSKSNNFNLTMLDQSFNYCHNKNSIVVTNGVEYQSLETIKKILTKNVILVDDEQSILKIIGLFKGQVLDTQNEIQYTFVEKVDFKNLLEQDIEIIKEFIGQRSQHILKLNSNLQAIDINLINLYLDIYKHRNILLASFAQSLYRLANLDFMNTSKAVGGNIREILGVGSEVISYKSLKMELPMAFKRNIRIYDLNSNEIETKVKTDIAQKLLLLENKDLDIEKIAKTVELPKKEIEKMYAKNILK